MDTQDKVQEKELKATHKPPKCPQEKQIALKGSQRYVLKKLIDAPKKEASNMGIQNPSRNNSFITPTKATKTLGMYIPTKTKLDSQEVNWFTKKRKAYLATKKRNSLLYKAQKPFKWIQKSNENSTTKCKTIQVWQPLPI